MESWLTWAAIGFSALIVVRLRLRRFRRRRPRLRGPQSDYRVVGRNKRGRPVYEHRRIAERVLNRKLGRHEVVHHINGIKDDNRVSNLCVMSARDHDAYHEWQNRLVKINGRYPKRATRVAKLKTSFRGVILDETG